MVGTEAGTPRQQPDDYELMRAIAARDQAALRMLYDRHSGIVYSLCLRVLRDNADAEEVLVEVFWEAWDKGGRYDAGRGSPLAYLTTLARSRSIDRVRSRAGASKRMAIVEDVDTAIAAAMPGGGASDNPLNQTIAAERRATVAAALAALEPQQRRAIECAYYDGLSHSEISEKLNKPLGTVKTWIRTGLIRLRDGLRTT